MLLIAGAIGYLLAARSRGRTPESEQLVPLVGGAQWLVGTTLALVIARRSACSAAPAGARRIAGSPC